MAKTNLPASVQIAALNKQEEQARDLMIPGKGIPWEDRGSLGFFPAFFKTIVAMLGSPNQQLDLVRRPETSKDATSFAMICAFLWSLAMGVQWTFNYFVLTDKTTRANIDGSAYVLNAVLASLLTGVGAFVLLKIASAMFHKMIAFDMRSKAPSVLIFNTMAYLMAPTVFAIIPGSVSGVAIGPAVALIWIVILWMVTGIGRLRIRPGGAIVASLMTAGVCAAIICGVSLASWFVWVKLLDHGSLPDETSAMAKTVQK